MQELDLDVIAVEGKGMYVTDGTYTWHLASEDYIEARDELRRHYPGEYL
jgi:hypothetical protein